MIKEKIKKKKPRRRIRRVTKTRHQIHRGTSKNNIAQVFLILGAFLLFGYVGFNLLVYLMNFIF